jgi:hypothetical protein
MRMIVIMAMVALALSVSQARAQKYTTVLNSSNLESHSATAWLGDYYTV